MVLFFPVFGGTTYRQGDRKVPAAGLLINLVGGTMLHGVLLSFLVTALLPVFTGCDDFVPFMMMAKHWWSITRGGMAAALAIFLAAFLPFIGNVIRKTPGTALFIQGAMIFHLLEDSVLREIMNPAKIKAIVFPGIWVTLGFVAVSVIAAYLVSFLCLLVLLKLKLVDPQVIEKKLGLIGDVVGVIPGMLCLSMYCAYIRLIVL